MYVCMYVCMYVYACQGFNAGELISYVSLLLFMSLNYSNLRRQIHWLEGVMRTHFAFLFTIIEENFHVEHSFARYCVRHFKRMC